MLWTETGNELVGKGKQHREGQMSIVVLANYARYVCAPYEFIPIKTGMKTKRWASRENTPPTVFTMNVFVKMCNSLMNERMKESQREEE